MQRVWLPGVCLPIVNDFPHLLQKWRTTKYSAGYENKIHICIQAPQQNMKPYFREPQLMKAWKISVFKIVSEAETFTFRLQMWLLVHVGSNRAVKVLFNENPVQVVGAKDTLVKSSPPARPETYPSPPKGETTSFSSWFLTFVSKRQRTMTANLNFELGSSNLVKR